MPNMQFTLLLDNLCGVVNILTAFLCFVSQHMVRYKVGYQRSRKYFCPLIMLWQLWIVIADIGKSSGMHSCKTLFAQSLHRILPDRPMKLFGSGWIAYSSLCLGFMLSLLLVVVAVLN